MIPPAVNRVILSVALEPLGHGFLGLMPCVYNLLLLAPTPPQTPASLAGERAGCLGRLWASWTVGQCELLGVQAAPRLKKKVSCTHHSLSSHSGLGLAVL